MTMRCTIGGGASQHSRGGEEEPGDSRAGIPVLSAENAVSTIATQAQCLKPCKTCYLVFLHILCWAENPG